MSTKPLKSGPKRIAKSTGKTDKRLSVTPENKSKHPTLAIHKEHEKDKK